MANINLNPETTASQKSLIKAYLLEGKYLTQLDALPLFGCMRLASVVNELRNDGLPIITEIIQVSPKKRVARYSLPSNYIKEYKSTTK